MKNTFLIICAFFLITSCATNKFDYQTAYKFSHYNYQDKGPSPMVEPVASLAPTNSTSPRIPSDQALKELYNPVQTTPAFISDYKNASKAEKKAIRQQVKQEYKLLRTEIKEAKKQAATKDIVFNQKMYIGLIVLAAGILVAILTSGTAGAIGAVAIIVGIALIAWGFIEQA